MEKINFNRGTDVENNQDRDIFKVQEVTEEIWYMYQTRTKISEVDLSAFTDCFVKISPQSSEQMELLYLS